MRNVIAGLALVLALESAHAAIREEPVVYKDGDTTMKGFVVYDDAAKTRRPGVIVVHEWWGITNHVRAEARKLATLGYTALIADMYGDAKTADNPKDASELSGAVLNNPPAMQSRFNAARSTLARHASVDPKKIGAIGFCFGGSVVLDMARAGTDIAGVAAFHAGLGASGPRAAPGTVKAKVIVFNGDADPFVKPETVVDFKKEMSAANVDFRFISYPGALHAFTNPQATALGKQFNLPLAYDASADKQSKAEMQKFLSQAFR